MQTIDELVRLQALPLEQKVVMTQQRIMQWVSRYGEDGVYISFSGGKDSTVLLDIVRNVCGYKKIPAVFVNVPTQYPELKKFAETFENVEVLAPKISFVQVCEQYGFPLISKEVSECVSGARKYLTAILNEQNAVKTRGADSHTVIGTRELQERGNTLEKRGVLASNGYTEWRDVKKTDGSVVKSENGSTSNHYGADTGTSSNTSATKFLELADDISTQKMTRGGTTQSTESCGVLRSIAEEIVRGGGNILRPNESKTFADGEQEGVYTLNARTAKILGVYEKDWGKKKQGIIPSNHDRSMFSQERYKFFLDAPFEISNMCCNVMKKKPIHEFNKESGRLPMTAQMAQESRLRIQQWVRNGCNGFQMKSPISNPMSFWTEQDILQYIVINDLPICSVYGDVVEDYGKEVEGQMHLSDFGIGERKRTYKCTGCKRTGCVLCGFGCHLEKAGEGRFEKLKVSHPRLYGLLDVVKNNGVTFREAIDWTNEHGNTHIRY